MKNFKKIFFYFFLFSSLTKKDEKIIFFERHDQVCEWGKNHGGLSRDDLSRQTVMKNWSTIHFSSVVFFSCVFILLFYINTCVNIFCIFIKARHRVKTRVSFECTSLNISTEISSAFRLAWYTARMCACFSSFDTSPRLVHTRVGATVCEWMYVNTRKFNFLYAALSHTAHYRGNWNVKIFRPSLAPWWQVNATKFLRAYRWTHKNLHDLLWFLVMH
jgi:hypothetical protein